MLYKEFSKDDHHYGTAQLLKFAWKQKILGTNRHIPWPVHPTSFVKGVDNIQRGTKYPGSAPGVYIDGRNGLIIEDNVWIGANTIILPGVVVGKNSIVAAGTVVTKSVPENSIVKGQKELIIDNRNYDTYEL